MADLFTSVLGLCATAGLVGGGVVAVDGTKVTASAGSDSNVDFDRIAREIISETIATDQAEDEQYGDARGDELPLELQTEAGRREWLARELARDRAENEPSDSAGAELSEGSMPSGSVPTADVLGCGRRTANLSSNGADRRADPPLAS